MITDFAKSVQELNKSLSKVKAMHINSNVQKSSVIDCSKQYFGTFRNYIKERNLGTDFIVLLDVHFQDLIRLAQGNNLKASYVKKIKEVKKLINDLQVQDVSIINDDKIEGKEGIILSMLESIIPTAALSYKQALIDLKFCTHKVSFRGTASELREALRETLDHLSPDNEVTSEQGFKLEKDQTRPTMKQKVRFILKKRGLNETKRIPSEKVTELIEELTGQLARAVYNRASLSTHVETTKDEVLQIKKYIDLMLQEILEIT
jgi:hypothetical protein